MDLKALMQKLEAINTTQIVAESVETKKVITESVAVPGSQSANPVFKSSIARSLAEEFGYALDEAPNDPNNTAAMAPQQKAMQAARTAKDGTTNYTSGLDTKPATAPAASPATAPAAGGVANPYQGADAAKFAAMSPADQAWLTKGGGQPDINDQFILARAPNKGAAVTAAPAAAPAADATAPAAADATAPGSFDSFGTPVAAGSPAATSADPTGLAQAQQDVNAAGSTPDATPAAATTEWPADKNAIIAFQKANGLTADGMIGPKTMQALQKSGATPPAGFKPVGAKVAPAMNQATAVTPPAGAFRGQRSDAPPAGAFRGQRSDAAPKSVAATPTVAYNAAKDSQAANTAAAPLPTTIAKAPGTASTQSNQAVQGTMKMGKPDGPITFNGKQVQPGAPEYAAASQALIAAQSGARNFKSRLAASGAPVSAGAPNVDRSTMENIQTKDDQILAIIRGIRVG